jgi:superoxide dismutase, Cu-Zn family
LQIALDLRRKLMNKRFVASLCFAFALAMTGCSNPPEPAAQATNAQAQTQPRGAAWADIKHAVAVIHPTAGKQARGVVHLTETADNKVRVVADLTGLAPNQKHGFHVHQYGDCSSPDATSAGDHYNPANHPHALPTATPRHAGDFGNVEADASGKAHLEMTTDTITLAGAQNPALGRAMIVHAQPDTGAQPSGNAGARVGCGVIGVAGPSNR